MKYGNIQNSSDPARADLLRLDALYAQRDSAHPRRDVRSFEEALRCFITAYQEAEMYARQCNNHRWADELSHFAADAAAFLDCYCRATWHTNEGAEWQQIALRNSDNAQASLE